MPLEEKQFEIAGVKFGLGCPVELTDGGWQPGTPALRTNDIPHPTGDGVRKGRTYRGEVTWGFSLYTNGSSEEEGWDFASALAGAWGAEEERSTPDLVLPLYYRVAGKERCVYGEPRRWSLVPGNMSMGGRLDIEADFVVVHPLYFDAVVQGIEVGIAEPLDQSSGLIVPFIPPFDSQAGAQPREAEINIGGTARTPIVVVFNGPVSDASVTIGDWTVDMAEPVVDGDPVTVDARPWVRSVTKASGGGARVNGRTTRLAKMWLPPGRHDVVFTGVDPTGSSSVMISWQDAFHSVR